MRAQWGSRASLLVPLSLNNQLSRHHAFLCVPLGSLHMSQEPPSVIFLVNQTTYTCARAHDDYRRSTVRPVCCLLTGIVRSP